MHSDYRREMDRIAPSPEAMARLEEAMRTGMPARRTHPLRFGRKLVLAAAVCAALALSAVAAGPTVWQVLQNRLGGFAPLAAPAEGVATDQGVEVRLVGSLSDGYEAKVYFTATDTTGGRFSAQTRVSAQLNGELVGSGGVLGCEVLSYDEDEKQLLVEASLEGVDTSEPMTLAVSGFDASGRTVQTELPRPEQAKTVPTTAVNGATVLLPGDEPEEIAEGLFLSAMGFDADGLFHIRIDYGEGYRPGKWLFIIPRSAAYPDQTYYEQDCIRTELEHGVDLAYPRVTREAWDDIESFYVDGGYSGPETAVRGAWEVPVTLEQVEKKSVEVDQTVNGFEVERAEVSQMSVVVHYKRLNGSGDWLTDVQLFDRSGDQVPLLIGMCVTKNEEENTLYTRWTLEEPVDLEDLDYLLLGGVRVDLD